MSSFKKTRRMVVGFSRSKPKKPPELTEAQTAEQERLKREKEELAFKESEAKRLKNQNLVGYRSLLGQDGDLNLSGYRRNMGNLG